MKLSIPDIFPALSPWEPCLRHPQYLLPGPSGPRDSSPGNSRTIFPSDLQDLFPLSLQRSWPQKAAIFIFKCSRPRNLGEFLGQGTPTPKVGGGGAPVYHFGHFVSKNCINVKEIEPRGVYVPSAPNPLPLMVYKNSAGKWQTNHECATRLGNFSLISNNMKLESTSVLSLIQSGFTSTSTTPTPQDK